MTRRSDMTKRGKLTAKQRKFVLAFAASGNATQAARDAGYKGTAATLRQVGSENLAKPDVAAAIAELGARADATKIADRDERQEWLTRVVRGEVAEGDGPAKLKDRLRAAELLSRMNGELTERRQIEGSLTIESLPSAVRHALRVRVDLPALAASSFPSALPLASGALPASVRPALAAPASLALVALGSTEPSFEEETDDDDPDDGGAA